jgi:pyrimidine-nucleoside phosphorylase/thymidine phosphorylase
MVALITRMDQPLGNAVGNALEVVECLECLRGGGPDDLVSLSLELAAEMVVMAGRATTLEAARSLCKQTVANGSALERFRNLVQAQGGDPRAVDDPTLLPRARCKIVLRAASGGFIQSLEARPVGEATMLLGAGRARMDSRIDPAVGVILHKKIGAPVAVDEPLCTLFVNDESRLEDAVDLLKPAFRIGTLKVVAPSLVVERISSRRAEGQSAPAGTNN